MQRNFLIILYAISCFSSFSHSSTQLPQKESVNNVKQWLRWFLWQRPENWQVESHPCLFSLSIARIITFHVLSKRSFLESLNLSNLFFLISQHILFSKPEKLKGVQDLVQMTDTPQGTRKVGMSFTWTFVLNHFLVG